MWKAQIESRRGETEWRGVFEDAERDGAIGSKIGGDLSEIWPKRSARAILLLWMRTFWAGLKTTSLGMRTSAFEYFPFPASFCCLSVL